jgi:SsrA-binding protein
MWGGHVNQTSQANQTGQGKSLEDRTVARNRSARHEFFILESMEVGIVLSGTEIKSVRDGRVNLKDGFARVDNGELWLYNVHISSYEKGTYYNKDPLRPRKLLAHRDQILKLQMKVREKGLTLVPLSMYLKEGRRAKIDLAVAKGKQEHDKRDSIAERDAVREINRTMRDRARRDI